MAVRRGRSRRLCVSQHTGAIRPHQNRQAAFAFSLRCGGSKRCVLLAVNGQAADSDGRHYIIKHRTSLNFECDAVQARQCTELLARRGITESNLCVIARNASGSELVAYGNVTV